MELLIKLENGYMRLPGVREVYVFNGGQAALKIDYDCKVTLNPKKPSESANFKPSAVKQEPVEVPKARNRLFEAMTPECRFFYILYNAWLKNLIGGLNWASKQY